MVDYLFFTLATMLILLSMMAVSLPNLLHGAISLIGSFFVTAALYILLRLEFVALSQIMLYIGGILIFMLLIIVVASYAPATDFSPVSDAQFDTVFGFTLFHFKEGKPWIKKEIKFIMLLGK